MSESAEPLDEGFLYYAASFVAFLVANAATFAVATQVYGDLFVLIVLGLVTGMLFAVMMGGIRSYQAHVQRYSALGASSAAGGPRG